MSRRSQDVVFTGVQRVQAKSQETSILPGLFSKQRWREVKRFAKPKESTARTLLGASSAEANEATAFHNRVSSIPPCSLFLREIDARVVNLNMNIFRILGDLSHMTSKCILMFAIHRNRSAEGVSLLTQLLYILVFGTRYLDLFWVPPWSSWWNTLFKLFYIGTSSYIVYIMMRVFARTREKEYAWKLATWSLVGSVVSAPVVCIAFRHWSGFYLTENLWTFSIILESVCVLPQLLLLRQTSVPTVIDSYYLVTLGGYRALYILNWIVRGATQGFFDPISIIFGVIQTALYVDFAWVYYSRQRVKLRGGGVVDADDLSKSFLVRRIIGRGSRADTEDNDEGDEEAQSGQQNGSIGRSARSWGARGISVSADETLAEQQRREGEQHGAYADDTAAGDAQMIDPDHFEDGDNHDDDADAPPPPVGKDAKYKGNDEHLDLPEDDSTTTWASNAGNNK